MTRKALIGAGIVLFIATAVILVASIFSAGRMNPNLFSSDLSGSEKSLSTISSEPSSNSLANSQTADSLQSKKTPQKAINETLNLNEDTTALTEEYKRIGKDELGCQKLNSIAIKMAEMQRNNFFKNLSDQPSGTLSEDELLANALFNNLGAHNERLDALTALKKENSSSIVAYEILRLCALQPSHSQCSTETIDTITSAHQNDSQIWMQAVNYFLATSQFELATNAANSASQGTYSTAVLPYFIQYHNQTLKNAGVGDFHSNTVAAVGLHAAFAQPLGHISKWCKNTSNSRSTAQACLNLGKLWELHGTDKFERSFGLSIQGLVYEAEENTQMLALTEQKRKDIYEKDSENEFEHLALVLSNESLLNSYLEHYAYGGQVYAANAVKTDIEDFKKTLEYKTCYQ
jgi:hypothetical protein